MTLQALVLLALKASIFLSVFAVGLNARPQDVVYLLQRPSLLVRSLIAMDVAMPVIVAAIVGAFELRPVIEVVLVALAVSPVPPLLPKKQIKASGDASYTIGLLVLSAAVAIVFVPVAVEILSLFLEGSVRMKAWPIAQLALATILAPLALGMIVGRVAPGFAERIARPAGLLAAVVLGLSILPVLVSAWSGIVALIGNGTIVAIAAFVVLGLAVGHWLGGPDPHDRAVLALATATRHPAVALAIGAANFPEREAVMPAILLYALLGALLAVPYLQWRRRVALATAP